MNKNIEYIYGINSVKESLLSNKTIQQIYVNRDNLNSSIKEIIYIARKGNIKVVRTDIKFLSKMAKSAKHQNVIALTSPIDFYDIENLTSNIYNKGNLPKLLMLDGITDTNNFGAIIRTANCFNIDAIIIKTDKSAQINSSTINSSAGAIFYTKICKVKSLTQTCDFLLNYGIKIIGATEKTTNKINNKECFKNIPFCLVMGSENRGISNEVVQKCNVMKAINISGKISSLNVSVATGILLNHLVND